MSAPPRYEPQPIAKVETAWHAPWMLVGCSQQGPMHFRNGALNADSYKLGHHGGRAWLVIADGVGSMPLAYHGSRAATAAVEQHLAATTGEALTTATMRNAFAAAHAAIKVSAQEQNLHPNRYATTLSAVALEGDTLVGGSIGDSGIVTCSRHGDGAETLMAPFCSSAQSEEQRKTHVISDPGWEPFATFNETVTQFHIAVVLATDGADNFFLKPSDKRPGQEFRSDIVDGFDAGIAVLGARTFFTYFAAFLQQYEPDNHDDRTILVAYRVPQDHAPPAAKPG